MISLERLVQIFLGVLLVGQFPNPAKAITFTLGGQYVPGQGQFSTVEGAETITFNSGLPTDGLVTYSANPGVAIVSGSLSSAYLAPAGDSSPYLTVAPFGNTALGTNPVTINFSKPIDYFGLYWGSINGSSDSISFYHQGNLVKSFVGSDIGGYASNHYVNFFTHPGELIDSITLSSSPPMETDNHAYRFAPDPQSVPEGGTLAMIGLAGIALFGSKRRRN